MPRIAIKRKDYMVKDLSKWIVGQMFVNNISQRVLAEKLSITQQAFSKKLKEGKFTYKDFLTIIEFFKPDDQELLKLVRP